MTDNEILVKYENLVYKIAISKHNIELFDDLLQEGRMALCRANRLFVPRKRNGSRRAATFMTYATVAINNAMNKYINEYRRKGLNVESLDDYHGALKNTHIGSKLESDSEVAYLITFVNRLPNRLIPIIISLYGLDGGCKTRKELSREMGISCGRVGQLTTKGLYALRKMLRGKR